MTVGYIGLAAAAVVAASAEGAVAPELPTLSALLQLASGPADEDEERRLRCAGVAVHVAATRLDRMLAAYNLAFALEHLTGVDAAAPWYGASKAEAEQLKSRTDLEARAAKQVEQVLAAVADADSSVEVPSLPRPVDGAAAQCLVDALDTQDKATSMHRAMWAWQLAKVAAGADPKTMRLAIRRFRGEARKVMLPGSLKPLDFAKLFAMATELHELTSR